jgi:glucokinase
VSGNEVKMTNRDWAFSVLQLQAALGVQTLRVFNDFTALALAIPSLQKSDLHPIGGGTAIEGETKALIGPGTGLGVSGLLQGADQKWVPIRGEGGHVTLSAGNGLELEIIDWLTKRFDHASAERALSGPGLVNLYDAVCAVNGQPAQLMQPAAIVDEALVSAGSHCLQTLKLFCGLRGSVAGDLALTLGARGGVYLGGGILRKMLGFLAESTFRERFVAKGRFRAYLDSMPTLVIDTKVPVALIGASASLDGSAGLPS